jgi:curved DNA-binding protein CbpA
MATKDPGEARKAIDKMHADVQRKNHFQLLGVEREADPERIKASYHLLAKKWHSDAYTGVGLTPADKAKLDEIFQKIGEAYEALTNPTKRTEYLILLDRKQKGMATDVSQVLYGEQIFDEALGHIRKRMWDQALDAVDRAINLNPDDNLYVATKGWILFHVGKRDDAKVKEAVDTLKDAIKKQENLPLAYQYLGQIYFAREMWAESKKWFKKCLEWDPQNVEAARGLRLVGTREEKQSSGLGAIFSKLLGKKK